MSNINEIIKMVALDAMESSRPVNVAFGKVVSISPLKIQVDQKLTLDESFLVLTRNVTDYSVEMAVGHTTEKSSDKINTKHSHGYGGSVEPVATCEGKETHGHIYTSTTEQAGAEIDMSHSHGYSGQKSFSVQNGLKSGETVLMLRMQGGQKYVVLDRLK